MKAGTALPVFTAIRKTLPDAIALADELGMKEEAEALSKRLENIKAVFRSPVFMMH